MGRAFGWIVALGLAFGAAGGASAATLPPMFALPLSIDAMPSVAAPPPVSFQLSGSESPSIWARPPEPTSLMLVATGLAGLVVLGHREFV
jgi:hypothetical protein